MNTTLTPAAELIAGFEGCRLKAYRDIRGKWTIGYGATYLSNGSPVGPGTTWTQAQADAALEHTVDAVASAVRAMVKVPTTENQLAALTSFAYNAGSSALAGSALLKKLNAGDYAGAADAFLQWERAGDNPTALRNRRVAERALFRKP